MAGAPALVYSLAFCSTGDTMKPLPALSAAVVLLCAAAAPAFAQSADEDAAAFTRRVNAFVDAWHDDAAHARLAYFDKMAPQGVYIGTDKTEVWTRDQFRAWARPYFERGKAWSFTAQRRNVYFSPDRRYVWFDEQLNTQMGTCQASGVLRNTGQGFLIEHYQLSMAVPNALNAEFAKAIARHEAQGPAKGQ
jgi:hypothetical protein